MTNQRTLMEMSYKGFFLSNKWGIESSFLHWDLSSKLQFIESNTLILLDLKARKQFNFTCWEQEAILLLSVGESSRYSQPFSFPVFLTVSLDFKHTLACGTLQLYQRWIGFFLPCPSSKLGQVSPFFSNLLHLVCFWGFMDKLK